MEGCINMDAALDYFEAFLKSLSDETLQKKLFAEFGLEEDI